MDTFLQVIGVLALVILFGVIAGYYYFKIKFAPYAKIMGSGEPLLIHINEDPMPAWTEKEAAKALKKELLESGFDEGIAYSVFEMDFFLLKAFYKAPYTAIIYDHPVAGNWVDLVALTTAGEGYTVTNAPMGGEIKTRPTEKKLFLKEYDVGQLYKKIVQLVGEQECVEVSPGNFREYVENEYKKDMAWKSQRGGISLEETKKIVQNSGKKYTEKVILESFLETKLNELHTWHNAALEVYQKEQNLSDNTFHELKRKMFIVPSKTDTRAFINYLSDMNYISEQDKEKFEKVYENETEINTVFNTINERLSPELRAVKHGEVDFPLNISIYMSNSQKF